MTNQTIDGVLVPRELLKRAASRLWADGNYNTSKELRALLDADPIMCHGCMAEGVLPDHFDNAGKCKPAAQRKIDPVVSGWQLDSFDEKLEGLDPTDTCTLSNHDVAQLVSAVRTLQARQLTEPAAQPQGVPVAMSRDQFEAWVLGREHPTYGWLDKHWLARGDNPDTYATEYVQGLWVASQALYAEQPAPVAVVLPARPRADEEEYERMTDYEKGLLHGGIELWDKIDEVTRLNVK